MLQLCLCICLHSIFVNYQIKKFLLKIVSIELENTVFVDYIHPHELF